MTKYIVCLLVQRLLLPALLTTCCLLRPVVLSLPYLIFLFVLPFIKVASPKTIRGSTGVYLITLMVVSILLALTQMIFQIVIASIGYKIIPACRTLEIVLRHIGLVRFNNLDALSITKWIAPEVIMLLTSISIFVILKVINREDPVMDQINVEPMATSSRAATIRNKHYNNPTKWIILLNFAKVLSLMALLTIATIQPSVLSFVYFMVFWGAVTWWGCKKELTRIFAFVLRVSIVFLAIHITLFLVYQNPWPQKVLKPDTVVPRILGLSAIYSSSCVNKSDIRVIEVNENLNADHYLHPLLLIICYFIISISSNVLLQHKKFSTRKRKLSDFDGIALTMYQTENLTEKESKKDGFFGNVVGAFKGFGKFCYKNSYILSNFVMMAWSIVYHSWLGFVLLIWANLIWIIPNPRRNMLYSSPILVIYAHLLLISTFLYGMNLRDKELPADIELDGFNLAQIGLVRYYTYPIGPLMLKTAFTLVFMISLRQFVQERRDKFTQTTEVPATESPFIKKLKKIIHHFFVRFWIFIVALTIFLFGLLGPRVTGIRIIYMALFLIFILIFTFSYNFWKNFLYGFLLLVVFYSMIILILVYTYQFDKFDVYWAEIVRVPLEVQRDIGLEIFDTKDLFLHLLTQTLIVIVVIIQLHYCHKKFKKMVELPQSQQGIISYSVATATPNGSQNHIQIKEDSKFTKIVKTLFKKFKELLEVVLLYLEIHFTKILMFSLFALMATNVQVVNILFVILAVIGVVTHRGVQIFIAKLSALICSIMLIGNMVYQLEFVHHENFDVNCTNMNESEFFEITNDAVWVGFTRVDDNNSLLHIINHYLAFIFIVWKFALLRVRQIRIRILKEQNTDTPKQVFENISRDDAEKDTIQLIKYLVNHGFYKFGVEICLIVFVIVIGVHMDIMACFYVLWFFILYLVPRKNVHEVWVLVIFLLMIMILLQYISFIGLPPSLCIEYPWIENEFLKDFKVWAILPKNTLAFKDRSRMLIADFILLLLMCRQRLVFHIEARFENLPVFFIGGTNKSALDHIEKLGTVSFVNPTHDFTSQLRNYLDVLKRFTFVVFYWLTLASVFLAGTMSVSIFSFGYIIGSFIFLWKGTDLYLLPVRKIQNLMNLLIGYNVLVIAIKVYLQSVGCLFHVALQESSSCWVSQLFSISCIVSRSEEEICSVQSFNSQIIWDGICFGFLMLQRRIFASYYFCHIVIETKASLKLASRGSELLSDLELKEKRKQEKLEARLLDSIKTRIEKIREIKQQNVEATEPKDHGTAVSSGEYYMFDDVDDKVELMDFREKDEFTEDKKSNEMKRLNQKLTLGQLIRKLQKEEEEQRQKEQLEQSDEQISNEQIEASEKEKPNVVVQKLTLVGKYMSSFLVSITKRCYRLSKEYRYVMRKLLKEKEELKIAEKSGRGSAFENQETLVFSSTSTSTPSTSPPLTRSPMLDDSNRRRSIDSTDTLDTMDDSPKEEQVFGTSFPIVVEFFISLWYLFLSNTDTICYIIVFANQVYSASILSLPLPLMVLLWGTLTLPRPSKSFWITLIVYTQLLVLLKFLFQFQFWPWVDDVILDNEPFAVVRILGIERKAGYATFDLLLLLALFWHRIILRSLGLWDTIDIDSSEMYQNNGNESSDIIIRRQHDDESDTVRNENDPLVENPDESLGSFFKKMFYDNPKQYYKNLSNPSVRKSDDVYKYLFLCDFIIFFVILFGFAAFGTREGDGGVLSYFQDNVVPALFLSMLIIQFFLIVLDRGLYLRKNYVGKIIFQYVLIIGLHVWMFFVLPATTDRSFNSTVPPILYYLIKCFYLLLSAYQIRCGYPLRILGNFLTKNYNMLNQYCIKVYMMIPFLMELRTLMDWVWTDTSMSMFEWLKMENIYGSVYDVKCDQEQGKESPDPSGQKYSRFWKYFIGGSLIVLIIAVIWFPLVLFALATIVGQASTPFDVSVSLRIGPYEPVYVMSAQDNSIIRLNETWDAFVEPYATNRTSITFLSNYEPDDVVAVSLRANSSTIWNISPPDRLQLLEDLKSNDTLTCRFRYSVLRRSNANEDPALISDESIYKLAGGDPIRDTIFEMINGNFEEKMSVIIPSMMPRFLAVRNRGAIDVVNQLQKTPGFQNVSIIIHSSNDTSNDYWWEAKEVCEDKDFKEIFQHLPFTSCGKHLTIFIFNDRIFPSTISIVTAGGIIGLYTTFILVFWNFFRSALFAGGRNNIMFENLPYVDRLLQLCLDIYLVREAMMFKLEEYLYSKLIFLYRSPETMIKWTTPPADDNNNENQEQ